MNHSKNLLILLSFLSCSVGFAQKDSSVRPVIHSPVRILTVEPGVGIHTNFGTDLLLATLVQWNPGKRLSFGAHTSFNINNITQRKFNHVITDYNYSINQKFGVGTTFYSKKSSHTFMAMVGAKYTAYQETLANPDFNKVSTSISSLSPDYGLMYGLKKGWNRYFLSFRMYIPLFPWPTHGSNINYLDGNMNNLALELGLGIKLK